VSLPFIIIVAVVSILVIVLFGSQLSALFIKTGCVAQTNDFLRDLESLSSAQRTSTGTKIDVDFNVPCGVDRIFFFDQDNGVFYDGFGEYPLLEDAIRSKSRNNVFLMKGGNVIDTLYVHLHRCYHG